MYSPSCHPRFRQFWGKFRITHLLTSGSFAVNGCRQNKSSNSWLKHHNNPHTSSQSFNILWSEMLHVCKKQIQQLWPVLAKLVRMSTFSKMGNTFKMIYDLLESVKKMTELQLFESKRVSRVDFYQNRAKSPSNVAYFPPIPVLTIINLNY